MYLLVNGKVDVFVKLKMPAACHDSVTFKQMRVLQHEHRNRRDKMAEFEGFCAV